MQRGGNQEVLFDTPLSIQGGLMYRPDFITKTEEEILLVYIENLELTSAHFREYTAKRRVKNFGWSYDFKNERLIQGAPLPTFLRPLQNKIAKWLDIPKTRIVEALLTEYPCGTAIGWHNDREPFEHIIGISLGGWCHMRFRPFAKRRASANIICLDLEPRSVYIMQKEIRWQYEHSILPTKTHRFSITFRTLPRNYKS